MTVSNPHSARNGILSSIRENLAASALFDANYERHATLPTNVTANSPGPMQHDLVAAFRSALESVGGVCEVVNGLEEASVVLQKAIDEARPQRMALSDSQIVREVTSSLHGGLVAILEKSNPSQLFSCDIGITSAQWAIAETGTLVLESEREFNRLASLIPDVHICFLPAGRIRDTMGEILQSMGANLSPAVTFITGPSRTSDIELTLAIGVHGPRELHVIIIEDE